MYICQGPKDTPKNKSQKFLKNILNYMKLNKAQSNENSVLSTTLQQI